MRSSRLYVQRSVCQIAMESGCLEPIIASPRAMGVVDSSTEALAIVCLLIDQGMSPKGVLERVAYSQLSTGFFNIIHQIYCEIGGTKLRAFEDAVLTSKLSWWQGEEPRFEQQNARKFLTRVKDLNRLIVTHRDRMFDVNGPFRGLLNANVFWQWRVRWFVDKHDLMHAWAELQKAIRGIPDSNEYSIQDLHADSETVKRCFAASSEVITTLTNKVFDLFAIEAELGLPAGNEIRMDDVFPSWESNGQSVRIFFEKLMRDGRFTPYVGHSSSRLTRTGAKLALLYVHINRLKKRHRRYLTRKPDPRRGGRRG